MSASPALLPREAVNAKLIGLMSAGAMMLGVFLSGFVIAEPAPYELFMVALIPVWALFGLRLSRGVAPLLVLFVLFNIGGMIAMTQMAELWNTPLYLAVSLFLALTAVFVAAVIESRPSLFRVMFIGWLAAAMSTSIIGVAGYFDAFPGADMFTRYGRATGAFEDPNVFGPFLALPAIWMLQRILTGPTRRVPLYAICLLVVAAGLFLSFSRGAWGLFAASSAMLVGALFLQSSSGRFRLRLVVMCVVALALLVLGVLVALQIPAVAELFTTRAQLVQYYDGARVGRFARHALGFLLAMEKPFGIGPLVFHTYYGEDTHNIWLKALLEYSWLGFASYLALILWTLAAGFRILFRDRPWQPYLLCVYVVLVGHVALGTVIDTDHWRHFYLLVGMVWGAIALEARHQHGIANGKEIAPSSRFATPAMGT